MSECETCGEEDCKEHSILLNRIVKTDHIAGSSPPEIFVGRWNYPDVYAGILAPQEYGNTEAMSTPEVWHRRKLTINDILSQRQKLIYGRKTTSIKAPRLAPKKLTRVMQEIAMTSKSIATEMFLKKPVNANKEQAPNAPLIKNAADIRNARLQENPIIAKKIDYLTNDTDAKSADSIKELHNSNISTSHIIKILSAGLLGRKHRRTLVPTRWAITAVDDTLSKQMLPEIKSFQEIGEYQVFHSYYVGNNYHFLLIPETFSFEVIELSLKNGGVWQDYETVYPRKKYADDVTGAYYVNRLALCEYLKKIRRQATCLVFREIRPEYSSPLGVGILRETSRAAFASPPKTFSSLPEALQAIQENLRIPVQRFTEKSVLLKIKRTQTKLSNF